MKIITHGGPADGLEYFVPDTTNHFEIDTYSEPDPLWYREYLESMAPPKVRIWTYQRTDQTDEEGRTVFVL